MDDLSAPAGSDAERRTGLTYSSIGVEVEEPLFLDEAEGDGASAGQPDPPSPFELFADEEALRPGPATLLAVPSPVAGHAARAWQPIDRRAAAAAGYSEPRSRRALRPIELAAPARQSGRAVRPASPQERCSSPCRPVR